jgi:hypothetical protein
VPQKIGGGEERGKHYLGCNSKYMLLTCYKWGVHKSRSTAVLLDPQIIIVPNYTLKYSDKPKFHIFLPVFTLENVVCGCSSA